MIYPGSCHCGAVTFTLEAPRQFIAHECNCSICQKAGAVHLVVPLTEFTLLSGEQALTTYTFGTGVAKHKFCTTCGIRPFYTPRLYPDAVAVNIRCLDEQPDSLTVETFDGQNWDQSAAQARIQSESS